MLKVDVIDMCQEPAYGPAGWGSATKPVPHVWAMSPDGKWFYCTRCTTTRPGPAQSQEKMPSDALTVNEEEA